MNSVLWILLFWVVASVLAIAIVGTAIAIFNNDHPPHAGGEYDD